MELLYTDNRIVVCLKPAGVLSTDEPGGMPELLRRALGEDETGCVRVVHRLDRPVGGVMVYARSRVEMLFCRTKDWNSCAALFVRFKTALSLI